MYYGPEGISHLRIEVEDILSATEDIDAQYLIGSSKEIDTYKAKLLWSGQLIDIVAQQYDRLDADGMSMFENSALTLSIAHKNRLHHVQYSGTVGYMDSIYEQTKGVTQKSDVFSFGVVLFEVLFWWKAWPATDDVESLVQRARSYYEEGTLEDMVDTDTWEEMDDKSFKIFSETAYSCLKDQRAQRPK
ncbi:hypothetical protein L1887_19615 [Cichorium endivia]|nr:hypothetical protein L1887_19615 [Cichorium endivia]